MKRWKHSGGNVINAGKVILRLPISSGPSIGNYLHETGRIPLALI